MPNTSPANRAARRFARENSQPTVCQPMPPAMPAPNITRYASMAKCSAKSPISTPQKPDTLCPGIGSPVANLTQW